MQNEIPVVQSLSHNEYMPTPMVSPPLANNMYHPQVQHPHVVIPSIIQHPGYVIPPNMVCYASPPIQVTYPQQILIPSNAVHSFTTMGHYYSVVPTQQVTISEVDSEHEIEQNGGIQSPILEPEFDNDKGSGFDNSESNNYTESKIESNEQTDMSPPQLVVQNGIKPTNNPSGGKSWASLFNNSNASPQQNGFINNTEQSIEKMKPVAQNEVASVVCPIKHPKKSAQFVDPDCYRMAGK